MIIRKEAQRANHIRIGVPSGQEVASTRVKGKKAAIKKLPFFQFCNTVRNDQGYYDLDHEMHEKIGPEPESFGPVFLTSDHIHECIESGFSFWKGPGGKGKLFCGRALSVFDEGVIRTGNASRRRGEDFFDFECNANECPDFKSGSCGIFTKYKFFHPETIRFGECDMTIKSYRGMGAMIGFLSTIMSTGLFKIDVERGIIHGLSKIPIMFEMRGMTITNNGYTSKAWYPTPVVYNDTKKPALLLVKSIAESIVKQTQNLLGPVVSNQVRMIEGIKSNENIDLEDFLEVIDEPDKKDKKTLDYPQESDKVSKELADADRAIKEQQNIEAANISAQKLRDMQAPQAAVEQVVPEPVKTVAPIPTPSEPTPEPQQEQESTQEGFHIFSANNQEGTINRYLLDQLESRFILKATSKEHGTISVLSWGPNRTEIDIALSSKELADRFEKSGWKIPKLFFMADGRGLDVAYEKLSK